MSALEEVGQSLATTITKATEAQKAIVAAGNTWNERGQKLTEHLSGTNNADAQHLLDQHETTAEDTREAWRKITLALRAIQRYRTSIEGEPTSELGAAPGASAPRTGISNATAPDGSEYPPEAAWVADTLPRRVRPGDKTVGYANGSFTDRFVSGVDHVWTPHIQERARGLGMSRWVIKALSSHVEMKVASMMIQRGQRNAEVVINNVPCGSRADQPPGCAQALERFLPGESTLTVHGTTEAGEPFTQRYEGRA
ncbi:SCP1.201-like deaminase [Actinopolyspora lacussalsi subsp. righensis]|uniref:SCP1.201-like deaminase n=1 Tax=Actinopolyspora righensis TaxID=995060 RepID=A0A1I6ZBU6_9ACTN|nr:DddA-like double-stranded DNA deaminase toxin [Actinopolyspora righensis]SFT60115.1 SCP1.201-like deaminase [Actinopolyspora righensis]